VINDRSVVEVAPLCEVFLHRSGGGPEAVFVRRNDGFGKAGELHVALASVQ